MCIGVDEDSASSLEKNLPKAPPPPPKTEETPRRERDQEEQPPAQEEEAPPAEPPQPAPAPVFPYEMQVAPVEGAVGADPKPPSDQEQFPELSSYSYDPVPNEATEYCYSDRE
jgi:hypothetical protein